MGIFSTKKKDDRVDALGKRVNYSFHKINESLQIFNHWVNYLSSKDEIQDYKLYELEHELRRQGVSKDQIRAIIQAKYQYHHLAEKVKDIDSIKRENEVLKTKVADLESVKHEYMNLYKKTQEIDVLKEYYNMMRTKIQELDQKISQKGSVIVEQKPSIKERIIRKFTQNSKEYTKNMILNFIQKYGEISALQLRDIVVEEQAICSKSSFYRALEELEKEGQVHAEKQGKEHRYKPVHTLQN